MNTYYLDDIEYDASGFLRALADLLEQKPGGWGGVAEDLREIAEQQR
jgi:hypothetical protein